MLVNRVVKGSFVLKIIGVHVGAVLEQQPAKLVGGHTVDQAIATVRVRLQNVGSVVDEELHDVVVRHVAARSDDGAARIRARVNVHFRLEHQVLDHVQIAGHCGRPQRCYL